VANVVEIILKATNQTTQALNKTIKDFGDFKAAAIALGPAAAAAGTAVAAALTAITYRSIQAADELNKASQKVGVTVESLSALKYAAEQSGVSFDSLTGGLSKLGKAAVSAAQGDEAASRSFEQLGVSVTNSNGSLKTNEELMMDVADKFSKMNDGAVKTTAAIDMFGKSAGPSMVPLLNQGRDGIEALKKEAGDLGLVISTKTAQQAEVFNDTMDKLKSVTTATGNAIMAEVLPSLSGFAQSLVESYKQGTFVKSVIDGIAAVLGFMAQAAVAAAGVIMSAFENIGTSIAVVGTAAVELFTGQWSQAGQTISEGFAGITEQIGNDVMEIAAIIEGNKAQMDVGNALGGDPAETQGRIQKTYNAYRKGFAGIIQAGIKGYDTLNRLEKAKADERISIVSGSLDTIASLATAKNKALAVVGKTLGIASATIDTYVGASKALAQGGFFGIAMASSVIAAGMVNVAKISGIQLAEGGVVMPRAGGVQATIAEAGVPEAVIPLDRSGLFGPSRIVINLDGRPIIDFLTNAQKTGEYVPIPV